MEDDKKEVKKERVQIEDVYPHAFWLEKFNKENKMRPIIFEKYHPNTRSEYLTPKFYSKYYDDYSLNKDYQTYLESVVTSDHHFPPSRDDCQTTVCENQEYGWIWRPYTRLDAKDRLRFLRPKCQAELSTFAEKLEEQKVTSRPKFGGLIFKL